MPKRNQNRLVIFCLSCMLLPLLPGCTLWDYLKPPEREAAPARGNLEEARELVHSFMQARIAGETEDYMRAFLTEEGWRDYQRRDFILKSTNSQELVGYKVIEESDLTEARYGFTIVVQEVDLDTVGAQNIQENIIVRYDNDEYRVSSARFVEKNLTQVKGDTLVWRRVTAEGQEEETPIVRLTELPTESPPIGGTPDQKLAVGRAAFSTVVLFPNNKGLAFSTSGGHSLIAIHKWTALPRKEEETGELIPLDLVINGETDLMAISPSAEHLAVETREAAGGSIIRVYRTDGRNRLNLGLDEAFPQDKYEVKFNRWEPNGDGLIVRVNARPGAADPNQNTLGTWEINIKTGEREKIIS
jgi:hypothetical protein